MRLYEKGNVVFYYQDGHLRGAYNLLVKRVDRQMQSVDTVKSLIGSANQIGAIIMYSVLEKMVSEPAK